MKKTEITPEDQAAGYIKAVELPSGKTIIIKPAKAMDAARSRRLIPNAENLSQDDYADWSNFALMAATCKIDGADMLAEDFANMSISDYAAFNTEYSKINFPSPAAK